MSKVLWIAISFCCLSCCVFTGMAQSIKGTVKDSLGKPLANISISLKTSSNLIVGYTSSNEKGAFVLPVPADAVKNALRLEAASIGFKKQMLLLTALSVVYDFRLTVEVTELKTVTIKDPRPRLKLSGDTLSYRVTDFSSPHDRVIGDVIRKLPGIEVSDNGKIKYNGKSISALNIGGDNLLDDKYNIATNSIPKGVVEQVQVIENYQPVKMMRGKVVSEDVALNLTIKKDAKLQLAGQESAGGGLPGQYKGELNAMLFKDQFKAINYLKANNTSLDLQQDLVSHNLGDYLRRLDQNKPGEMLSLGTAGDPDLPRNRYLFNHSALLNLNNLVHLRKDVLFRANVYALRDVQRQNYQKNSEIYLIGDTVRYQEFQRNKKQEDLLHGQFLLNVNKDKYFLNNTFSTDFARDKGYSYLVANDIAANQLLKMQSTDLSNEFNLMKTYQSSYIIEMYSYLNHYSSPENLAIQPGYRPELFNQGQAYQELRQQINIPGWFTNNYLSYKIPSGLITQSYKAGFTYESQKMVSDLSLIQSDYTENLFTDSARNTLDWSRRKLYAEAGYDIPGQRLKVNLKLPLSLQQIRYADQLYRLDESRNRLFFNPSVNMRYQTGIEHYITAGYNFRNNIGDIQDVFRGAVLRNYRTLYANNALLSEQKTQRAALGFNYHKAITMFFFNAGISYTRNCSNTITTSLVSNNLQQRIVLPFDNAYYSWTANVNSSKYIFPLRTTFSAGVAVESSRSNQILNTILSPYRTLSTVYTLGAESKISNKINMSYISGYTAIKSMASLQDSPASQIRRISQQGSLNYNATERLYFRLSGDHYFARQQQMQDLSYLFADLSCRYKFKKRNIDLELNANNLFNKKNYSALYLSGNTFTANSYRIPGRMLLFQTTFNI
jgi:hypothetical protein